MGIIKFYEYANLQHSNLQELNVINWRGLRETVMDGQEGVYFIDIDFSQYFIFDITISEIHELNYCNKTIEKPFIYINNRIVCSKCSGEGVFWWVDQAMPKNTFRIIPEKYERNAKGDILVIGQVSDDKYPYYVSTPHKRSGQEFCNRCCGTGFYFVSQECIIDIIQLEYS